ncbi:alpha-1,4-glucan--maltose-1-phosphate maltosyltransferase [Kribbella jiaozuonensis]|uniref:Alpha-1,4-glucan:maltose-1-phosphate maltosyltransferase n=1 Tax=Kribbella jiaozuonensis TaxID=2575441 RepID=A0A4U3LDD9_9ACTN|nr:alpha-1,4-glucan--maltose-1-phosphate maltosyltransferase [Kribbella jiaozuonensis]TKK73478.1 alpha-1,4-glucan--maltose-1-phosphate maltosyltransferase [Kribbella jiaozuonensis]
MTGRIPITEVTPTVDAGAYPAKAAVGETFTIAATVFREGHDAVNANVVLTSPSGQTRRMLMSPVGQGSDRWTVDVTLQEQGAWTFAVEGWSDPYGTWRHNAEIKVPAGLDVDLMFAEGAAFFDRAAAGVPPAVRADRGTLSDAAHALANGALPPEARLAAGISPQVRAALGRYPVRELITSSETYPVWVDRRRALYGSWYEFFPRSEGAKYDEESGQWTSGTFRTAAQRLEAVAKMGFDILYVPPIHPVGHSFRKGPNNTLDPKPGDPGSPWAIGSEDGGHDAIHPELGTFEDFEYFVGRAREVGLEVAIDLALQASPDHPWVKDHPKWFAKRADGSIAYAENPPKKYQDIYPINFDDDPEGIYAEVLRIVRLWISKGVTVFRVDNPHTKPVNFWEYLLGEIRKTDPDVVFLSEAFTRRPMMRELAKVGFHQSYTYFTWRNEKWELEEYLTELTKETGHYLRPNFFVNTPDILTAYLQYGGPGAFKIRAAIASTSSPAWGVYAGYELFEHVALRPGSEEYLDTEKFQLRPRDWAAAEAEGRSLAPYLTLLNNIRRRHPSLQQLRNLSLHTVDDEAIMCYSKRSTAPDGHTDTVIVVVNTDPHSVRESMVHLDMAALGMRPEDTFTVYDEISGATWRWGQQNYIKLDPNAEPAHILAVRRGQA